jgi:hypothetical protein
MALRFSCFLLILSIPLLASAKEKNKDKGALPDYVVQARTVQVVVNPEASDSLENPMANTAAREAVQNALQAWGRFTLVVEGGADLVIAVRAGTGKLVAPAVERGPTDTRIGDMQPGRGNIGIGAQQGRVPADSDPGVPVHTGPHIGKEIGRANDVFEVYRGRGSYSVNSLPMWRYTAKDALKAPSVPAVEQFRKAIDASEKKQKKP